MKNNEALHIPILLAVVRCSAEHRNELNNLLVFTFSGEKTQKSTKIFTLVECNPYRYKVLMYEQDTDKGEVGSSSLPRPTNCFIYIYVILIFKY